MPRRPREQAPELAAWLEPDKRHPANQPLVQASAEAARRVAEHELAARVAAEEVTRQAAAARTPETAPVPTPAPAPEAVPAPAPAPVAVELPPVEPRPDVPPLPPPAEPVRAEAGPPPAEVAPPAPPRVEAPPAPPRVEVRPPEPAPPPAEARPPAPPPRVEAPPAPPPRPTPRVEAPPPPPPPPERRLESAEQEAYRLWHRLQALKQQLAEVRRQMKEYKVFGIVKRKFEEQYEELEDREFELEEDIEELKEDYKEAVEEAAEALGKRPSEVRARIERPPEPAPPRPERPATTPARRDGETNEEYIGRAGRFWIFTKGVGKVLFNLGLYWFGGAIASTGFEHLKERRLLDTKQTEVKGVLEALERNLREARPEPEQEAESVRLARDLEKTLGGLVEEGYLTREKAAEFKTALTRVAQERARAAEAAQGDVSQGLGRVWKDYITKKVTGWRHAAAGLSDVMVAAGAQIVRGIGFASLLAINRVNEERKRYVAELESQRLAQGGEFRNPSTWKKVGAVAWRSIAGASRDTAKGVGYGFTLAYDWFAEEKVRRDEFRYKGQSFYRSILTLGILAGLGKAAIAEWRETGELSPFDQIERIFKEFKEQGFLGATANHYVHNVEQITGLKFGADGQAVDTLHPTPAVAAAPTPPELTPEQIAAEKIAEFEKAHPMLVKQGFEVRYVDGHLRLEAEIGDDPSDDFAHDQQALRRLGLEETEVSKFHGQVLTDGTRQFDEIDGARVERNVANLHELIHDRQVLREVLGMTPEQVQQIVHLDPVQDKLVITDYAKFAELYDKLEAHAIGHTTEASPAVAEVNDTAHSRWQGSMDQRFAGTDTHVVVKDFDDSPVVHQAEVAVAEHEVATHEIPGLTVNPAEVIDEDNYPMHLGTQTIPVEHGTVDTITTIHNGHEFTYTLSSPISTDSPNFGDELKHALEQASTQAGQGGGAPAVEAPTVAAAAEAAPVAAPSEPHDPRDLTRTLAQGGLVGSDGRLHFGTFAINEGWFIEWDDMSIKDFIEEAPARFSLARLSAEHDAHYKLAQAMEVYDADPKVSVGKWMVENYKKIGEWVR